MPILGVLFLGGYLNFLFVSCAMIPVSPALTQFREQALFRYDHEVLVIASKCVGLYVW